MEAFFSDPAVVTLISITMFAAVGNGALGYGARRAPLLREPCPQPRPGSPR